jgi:ABC-type polysaccharide/polyol phosphate transport system ATPase subunit
MARILAEDVSFRYPVYTLQAQSIRSRALSALTGRRVHGDVAAVPFVDVFSDVCFSIERGQRVAVLGRNGAGKSSLLRMLAGIYAPWSGRLIVEGSIGALFDLGGGMDVDLTARENILRAGVLHGLRVREVEREIEEIEAFVDIGRFFDLPVRTYSAGMTIRVAFAMSTLIRPEIFIIDEVYGAGDIAFQKNAEKRINSLIDGADILVFSSHALDIVRALCNCAMLLDGGRVKMFGGVEEVIEAYLAG